VTIWMLGLSALLLLFGGLAIDFWRALEVQRAVATMADSAAIAGASGIDELHYRTTGEVVLEPDRVVGLANASIGTQGPEPSTADVQVSSDLLTVTVTIADELELGLLGLFVDQSEPLLVRASATATPRLVP
jgi:Flp pilus assembly protein TadG